MRKLLTIISGSVALLSLNSAVFAANLDSAAISTIHQQIKSAFVEKCKSSMGASDITCGCLSDKADKSLDDAALGQCANDASGSSCITQAVSKAATVAMSQANIEECTKLDPAAAAAAAAPATAAPAVPAAAAPATAAPAAPAAAPAPAAK
ncbi:MAG: hypothetical protein P4M14_04335 [Gammaproteobacteria bacterium]|nr:hypothetical protein [Gammaproteobacteria bacterium]